MRHKIANLCIGIGCIYMHQIHIKQAFITNILQYCITQYWPMLLVGLGMLLHIPKTSKKKKM